MDLSLGVDSILHRFGRRTILTDVYLKCQKGDIIGLFGRNGTGKTTLFRIIFGDNVSTTERGALCYIRRTI